MKQAGATDEVREVRATNTQGEAPGAEVIGVEALFRAHAAFIATFLQRLGATKSEVDDLVQEVFLVVHRKGGYVLGPAQPRTWLAAIAVHVARAGMRARRKHAVSDTSEVELSASPSTTDPERRLEARESLARVQRALDQLDFEHRVAFVLYEIEGASGEAVSQALGVPIGTVYSRLHYARKRFLEAHAQTTTDKPASAPRVRMAEGT